MPFLTEQQQKFDDLRVALHEDNRTQLKRTANGGNTVGVATSSLPSNRSIYEKRETALRNRQSDLLGEKSAQAEEEKDTIFHQLKEIESLRKKIDELLSEGYDPKLDDGVGKNIAPLQKRGIIAYEVLNPGQLKKYLNADW